MCIAGLVLKHTSSALLNILTIQLKSYNIYLQIVLDSTG